MTLNDPWGDHVSTVCVQLTSGDHVTSGLGSTSGPEVIIRRKSINDRNLTPNDRKRRKNDFWTEITYLMKYLV